MPHYGYRCQSCQREFETLQRMADPPQAACPDCGGPGTRLFYAAGILFKGSGFYKTDSRATPDLAAPSPSGAAAKAGDGTGDTKPAASGADSKAAVSPSTTPADPPPTTAPASD